MIYTIYFCKKALTWLNRTAWIVFLHDFIKSSLNIFWFSFLKCIGAKGRGEKGTRREEGRGNRWEERGEEGRRATRDIAQSGHALWGLCKKSWKDFEAIWRFLLRCLP